MTDSPITGSIANDSLASGSTDSMSGKFANIQMRLDVARYSSTNKPNQLMFDKLLQAEVSKAEIIWCLRSVYLHLSQNCCNGLNQTFPLMFPDSEIAKKYQMGPDKLAYIVSYGIAPYFKDILMNQLKQSTVKFTSFFDEAFNDVIHKGQFDVQASFFDNTKNEVSVRYLGSAFLGHSRGVDLLEAFNDVHKGLNISKQLIQVSMDGPNVNWVLLDGIKQIKKNDPSSPEIQEMGSCGLHVIHGAYKAGQEAVGWQIQQFLKCCYSLFKTSPARRADYLYANEVEEGGSSQMFPLKFCGHRWFENGQVLDRIVQILPSLQAYVCACKRQPKSKRPSCSSMYEIEEQLISPQSSALLLTRLEFSRFVCHLLEPFLSKFQSEKPMCSLLYQDLMDLTKRLLAFVITDEAIANSCTTGAKLCQIDLEKNRKPSEKCDFGFGTKAQIKKISLPSQKLEFRLDCQKFIVGILKKIFDRSPLKYNLTRAISALSLYVISDSSEQALKRFDSLLTIFHEKSIYLLFWLTKRKSNFQNSHETKRS